MNSSAEDFKSKRRAAFRNRFVHDFCPCPSPGARNSAFVDESQTIQGSSDSQLNLSRGSSRGDTATPILSYRDVLSTLPPSSLESQPILHMFIGHCLPPSRAASQEMPLQWLQSMDPSHNEPRALSLAISALASGWAGHVNDHPKCIEKGLKSYVAAVGELRKDISHTSAEQAISTISLLTLYELYEFGSEFSLGWMTHLKGMGRLFVALGPSAVSKTPLNQIFSFYRIIEVSTPPAMSAWGFTNGE